MALTGWPCPCIISTFCIRTSSGRCIARVTVVRLLLPGKGLRYDFPRRGAWGQRPSREAHPLRFQATVAVAVHVIFQWRFVVERA